MASRRISIIGLCLIGCFVSSIACAQSISEPLKVVTPEYTHFFHRQIHKWFSENVSDFTKGRSESDKKFVDSFIAKNDRLGVGTQGHFIKAFSYSTRITNNVIQNHRFSFIDFSNNSEIRAALLASIKAHSISAEDFGLKDQALGLGWSSLPNEYSIFVYEPEFEKTKLRQIPADLSKNKSGAVVVEFRFEKKKLSEVSVTRIAVNSEAPCPPAIGRMQTDQKDREGRAPEYRVWFRYFEMRAVESAGEKMWWKIRSGLNMSPSAVDWTSLKDYELIYP